MILKIMLLHISKKPKFLSNHSMLWIDLITLIKILMIFSIMIWAIYNSFFSHLIFYWHYLEKQLRHMRYYSGSTCQPLRSLFSNFVDIHHNKLSIHFLFYKYFFFKYHIWFYRLNSSCQHYIWLTLLSRMLVVNTRGCFLSS